MKDEFKRNELLCSSKFYKQGKDKLPKMKQDFSKVNANEVASKDLTASEVREMLYIHNHSNDCDRSMLHQLIYSNNAINEFNGDNVFDIISKTKKINVKNDYFFYGYTSGLDCSIDKMTISSVLDNRIEVEYTKPSSNHEFLIADYLRNKRPSGKIPTEMFVECESDSDEDKPTPDVFNIIGTIKVSNIKQQNTQSTGKLLVTGIDKFGREIQAFLSQQSDGNCYICKFTGTSTVELCNGVEYFGQITFNDIYHAMSLEKSFHKLLLETGEFKFQLILKFARFVLAAKLLRSPDSADQITQLQKITSNIIWSCAWQNWEYAGPNLLTDLSAATALETPIDQLLEQGRELEAPPILIESMRNMIQMLDTESCDEKHSLKILDIYKTQILPAFNEWYQGIRLYSTKGMGG